MTFRKYVLSTGREIFMGKDSATNDELVESAKKNDTMLHTASPGSPFVNVGEEPTKGEIKEAAIFCAKHSQDWRDNKKDVVVNVFLKKDMNKDESMKEGTWSVGNREDTIKVKKSDILRVEKIL